MLPACQLYHTSLAAPNRQAEFTRGWCVSVENRQERRGHGAWTRLDRISAWLCAPSPSQHEIVCWNRPVLSSRCMKTSWSETLGLDGNLIDSIRRSVRGISPGTSQQRRLDRGSA